MRITPALLTTAMLGLVGLLVVGYVAKRMLATDDVVVREETVTVPMALTDLDPGTVITESHIGMGPASRASLDREVLKTQRVVVGRVVRNPIERAQPIRTSDLYAVGERPPLELAPGMRAVSVGLSDETSLVDGLIQPGQHVDVLFTPDTSDNVRGGMVMLLFRGVKALAINRNQAVTPSLGRGGNNVTLELTPQQANILVLARQKGDINLTYNPNGLGDGGVAVADEDRAYLDEILGLDAPLDPKPPFVTELFLGNSRVSNSFGRDGQLDRDQREAPRTMDSGVNGPDREYPVPDGGRESGATSRDGRPRGASSEATSLR